MSLTITIQDDLVEKIKRLLKKADLKMQKSLFLLLLSKIIRNKKKFYHLTDDIRAGIEKQGYTVTQIIDEIERLRHEDHHCG